MREGGTRHLAAAGVLAGGFWLAAPAQAAFVISTDATHNVSCVGGTCTSTAAGAMLNASRLSATVNRGLPYLLALPPH
ncbi:MAG: hypothetical protein JOZ72_03085 [Alphaproteobacteria bacterium]|nr:hypothetical protein [Alphaproteobacteria bacterium]